MTDDDEYVFPSPPELDAGEEATDRAAMTAEWKRLQEAKRPQ